MLEAVLFDLDGTLLPMDYDRFVKEYISSITRTLLPAAGGTGEEFALSVWKGLKAMFDNDGRVTNREAFWNSFAEIYGEGIREKEWMFDSYYENEFEALKDTCGYDEAANGTVKLLKAQDLKVALATNPIFPKVATDARIRWAGLDSSDFELITVYDTSHYTKPKAEYYLEVADMLGVAPEACLMVGNDASDDMPAENVGMKVFLLTDCLLNKKGADISRYPKGSFSQLVSYIDTLK